MNQNEIKALTPTTCPHCQKPIIVEIIATAPSLSNIHTPDTIEEAKQEALRQIGELSAPEENTKHVIDWINDPNTIFGPGEIKEIIKNIKEQNESEEK